MRKGKIIALLLCALVLAAFWGCWEYPMNLGNLLPAEEWTGMEVEKMLPNNLSGDIRYEEVPMDQILTQFQATRVNRGPEKRALDDECFRITLYKEDAWPAVIYVGSAGSIAVAADMRSDEWKDYEGGEALYQWLLSSSRNWPAIYPAAENS